MQLFLARFVESISGAEVESMTLYQLLSTTAVVNVIQLVGYYAAAFSIDKLGRRCLQCTGFVVLGILYGAISFGYDELIGMTGILKLVYLVAAFFGQVLLL